jgi:predicted ATPase
MQGVVLLGRDREIDRLRRLVAEQRLVTVTGTGGIGKTTLAERIAEEDPRPDGSRCCELARLDARDASLDGLAGLLDLPSFDALLTGLADTQLLLVLDNCEHVLELAAAAADRIVRDCPGVRLLATSRHPLGVPGEYVLTLGPLELPSSMAPGEAASVQLFYERARAGGAVLGGEAAELESVASLCRRLDGVPLAIELAASRARAVTPGEMLGHLDRRFDLLERRHERGPRRLQSLRATVDWSYELLAPDARDLFEHLGVFAGPFTATMAHAVCAEPGASELSTLDGLGELVDRSLLTARSRAGTTWYELLETLRAYAVERLGGRGELVATQRRLAEHALATVGGILARGRERWTGHELVELLEAFENLRAALLWSLAHEQEPTRAFSILMILWGVLHQGHTAEVAALGARVLETWDDPELPLWYEAASTVAAARIILGDRDGARSLAEAALARAPDGALAWVTTRRTLALAYKLDGDVESARSLFAEGASEARRLGVVPFALELEVFEAQMLARLGDVEEGLARCRRVQSEAAALGSTLSGVWARTVEGYLLLGRDREAARPVLEEALEQAQGMTYPWGIGGNLRSLAILDLLEGRPVAAAARFAAALDHFVERGYQGELGNTLCWSAAALEAAGRREAASRILVAALTMPGLPILDGLDPRALAEAEERLVPADPASPLEARAALALARAELQAVASDAAAAPTEPARPQAVLRVEGEAWLVSFEGSTVRVANAKGLGDLAVLLGRPGREVHCLELAGTPGVEGDAGPRLDAEAKRQYQARVQELQEELEEALAHHDPERAERLRAELEAIADQLASAFGLGGRERRLGDAAERARSTVTRRLRAAISRLAELHPALGRHLRSSIRTGFYCVYDPERPTRWRVEAPGGGVTM